MVNTPEKFGCDGIRVLPSLEAKSLDVPTEPHPNKMPFSGILTRIDVPSDGAPEGSGGKRVMITKAAAEKALDSLLLMAVDFTPDLSGHDPQMKIGIITAADIQGDCIVVNGFIYAADFPDVAAEIKKNKHLLGMSFEARNLLTNDPDADPVPIIQCTFTGAAILFKDKAAYTTTSINAKAQTAEAHSISDHQENFFMSEELKKQIEGVASSVAKLAEAVAAQSQTIAKLNEDKVNAANHLAKVEPYAQACDAAADKMDAAGIGGHPTRGHAAILRDMASSMRADAAQGKMPHIYHPTGVYASADVRAAAEPVKVDVDGAVKAAVEKATADFNKQIADLKAAATKEAEDAAKKHADAVAALETQMKDLKAKAEDNVTPPERKTFTPSQSAILAKAGVEIPNDGSKLEIAKLDKLLASAGLSTAQKFEVKTALARNGVID